MKRIVAVLLSLCLAFVMAGCGSKTDQPQPVFEAYMAALQDGDLDKASTYLTDDAGDLTKTLEGAPAKEAVEAWLGKMDVDNVTTEIDGDSATVSFDLTAPDLNVITKSVKQEMMELLRDADFVSSLPSNQDEAKGEIQDLTVQKLVSAIEDSDAVTSTQSGTATLVKTDDGWRISKMNVEWQFQSNS